MEKGHPETYGQRVTDVVVVEAGKGLGIQTYIVVPPTICTSKMPFPYEIEYFAHI